MRGMEMGGMEMGGMDMGGMDDRVMGSCVMGPIRVIAARTSGWRPSGGVTDRPDPRKAGGDGSCRHGGRGVGRRRTRLQRRWLLAGRARRGIRNPDDPNGVIQMEGVPPQIDPNGLRASPPDSRGSQTPSTGGEMMGASLSMRPRFGRARGDVARGAEPSRPSGGDSGSSRWPALSAVQAGHVAWMGDG